MQHATPAALKPGDVVVILSTARKIPEEQIAPAREILESWGLVVRYGANLFSSHHQFAGDDEARAADLQAAINAPEVKAVICARGGYGTVRMVDKVDFSPLQDNPKWIGGYSDVTVLHNRLARRGLASLHATMPVNFQDNTPATLDSLKNALFGAANHYEFDSHPLNRPGSMEGIVVGGNLSILFSLAGTDDDLDLNDKILFIEDLDEYLYHIDRMMQNFRKSGKLANLRGLLIGGMSDMNDHTIPFGWQAEEIIAEIVSEYNYPVCFGFPAGHQDDNRTIKLGAKAIIKLDSSTSSFTQS